MTHKTDHDRIPTLTDIVQAGDPSMKNHFDTAYFDEPEQPQLATDEQGDSEDPALSEELRESITLLIQDALNEAMPVIEDQLKQQLTEKVLEKLARDEY